MSNSLHNELDQTSSIGAAWPPAPGPYERWRGFYTDGITETEEECRDMASLFEHYSEDLANNTELTRLSIRFVSHVGRLATLERMGVPIEAAIPLDGVFDGLAVAYASQNDDQRTVSSQRLEQHRDRLQSIASEYSRDLRDRSMLLQEAGYTPNILDSEVEDSERRDREQQFFKMYAIFGYDVDDVRDILSSSSNTIAFVEREGEVVSTSMAERASIPIEGVGTLELCEMTEASTLPTHRGRGLFKAVSGLLHDHLISHQDVAPIHAIYGESNLSMPGALIAGHKNGRRYSVFDQERFGLQNYGFGVLQQNFRVEDGEEQRRYNDFAVSYIPLSSERSSHERTNRALTRDACTFKTPYAHA